MGYDNNMGICFVNSFNRDEMRVKVSTFRGKILVRQYVGEKPDQDDYSTYATGYKLYGDALYMHELNERNAKIFHVLPEYEQYFKSNLNSVIEVDIENREVASIPIYADCAIPFNSSTPKN